jgi:hypothetical protein
MRQIINLNRGKNLTISAITSAILVLAAAVVGSAGLASAATGSPLCNNRGTGLCLTAQNGKWGPGRLVVASAKSTTTTGAAAQDIVAVPDNWCAGANAVTMTCPFTVGLGINKALAGHAIYQLKWADHTTCIGINAAMQIDSQNCVGGVGNLWVKLGSYAYVNRVASDDFHKEMVLTTSATSGTTNPHATVGVWKVNNSQWKFE